MKSTVFTETKVDQDGVVTGKKWIHKEVKDTQQFVKMYTKDLCKLVGLSHSEYRVLINIQELTEYNTNVFFLNKERREQLAAISNVKLNTVNVAISHMMKKNVLIKESSSMYRVNPALFFKGDDLSREKVLQLVISYQLCADCK